MGGAWQAEVLEEMMSCLVTGGEGAGWSDRDLTGDPVPTLNSKSSLL